MVRPLEKAFALSVLLNVLQLAEAAEPVSTYVGMSISVSTFCADSGKVKSRCTDREVSERTARKGKENRKAWSAPVLDDQLIPDKASRHTRGLLDVNPRFSFSAPTNVIPTIVEIATADESSLKRTATKTHDLTDRYGDMPRRGCSLVVAIDS